MSLIRTETRDTKRAADPLHDLRSKPFSEWGEDEIRRFNLIDALLEFVYTDTSSPFGIGMTFDYTECWEIGVRDDCPVMTRVKPVHPEYAKHWNMKGVMNDKTRFHADKWVGYSKVLASGELIAQRHLHGCETVSILPNDVRHGTANQRKPAGWRPSQR